jgi:hypothetical protein
MGFVMHEDMHLKEVKTLAVQAAVEKGYDLKAVNDALARIGN